MSNLSSLKTALETAAASISYEIDRLKCLAAIDTWYACRTALDTLSAGQVASYSIAGRSVTKRDIPQLAERVAQLWAEIDWFMKAGGVWHVDLRDPLETWSQT